MPFDAMTMSAVADEVRAATGGQIQRIIQPSAASIALGIYGGERRWLVLSADARYARVHFSERALAKGFATPSPFVMLLRKYLEGGRLQAVEQTPYERILRITAGHRDEPVTLVAEVMGKHSNVLLVAPDDRILGAIKIVTQRQSRVRPVIPGRDYSPPPLHDRDESVLPPGPRIDPFRNAETFEETLRAASAEAPLRAVLLGLLPGAGPFVAGQIALRSDFAPEDSMAGVNVHRVTGAAADLYSLLQTRQWEPCVFTDVRGKTDFAPYVPVGYDGIEQPASISEAIDRSLGSSESRDALAATRGALTADIERARRAAAGRVVSLQEGLEATANAGPVMEQGQLVLAYQHTVTPRSDRLEIPELSQTIPLDPALSPQENAERLFHRYRKLREAERRIPGLLASAEVERARLDDLLAFARIADSEAALADLRRELVPQRAATRPSNSKPRKRQGPARYRMNGFQALVGRNARENEEVTFGLAARDNWWLHARERTGAHVVLSGQGDPPEEVLAAAASLAAHFSEARSDTAVDVILTRVRDVRKIPGGPPGRVTYRNERTIRVRPGLVAWERV